MLCDFVAIALQASFALRATFTLRVIFVLSDDICPSGVIYCCCPLIAVSYPRTLVSPSDP
jgi:hypothetical protein